jgi:hypothetical protein
MSVICFVPEAMGQDLFPAGSENKARGIESPLASERGSAVLYNPSNLTTTPARRAYVEAGMINVNYAYEHPQYDPVIVKTNSPLMALGFGGLLRDRWFFGAMLHPTKGGKMEVPGVPRDVSGVVVPVAVRNEDLALRSGFGLGFRWSDDFRVGLSILHQYEHRKLSANIVGNPVEVMNYDVYHQSLTPKLGARYRAGAFTFATGFSPAAEKRYRGTFQSAGTTDVTDVPIRDYTPTQWSLGVAANFQRFTWEAVTIYDGWEAGREVYQSGQGKAATADLSNTISYGTSLSYDTGRKLKFLLGYAHKPSPWGEGRQADSAEDAMAGADFGVLNGISRSSLSGGTQMVLSGASRLEAALLHARGARETSADAAAIGRYQIAITAATVTFSQQF